MNIGAHVHYFQIYNWFSVSSRWLFEHCLWFCKWSCTVKDPLW